MAVFFRKSGDPYGTRTRVAAVKGQCPRPLDEGVNAVGEAAYRRWMRRLASVNLTFLHFFLKG